MASATQQCGECSGTGVYRGLLSEETCQACGGSGHQPANIFFDELQQIDRVLEKANRREEDLPPDAVNDRYKESVPASSPIELTANLLRAKGGKITIRSPEKQRLIEQVVDFIDAQPQERIEEFNEPAVLVTQRLTALQYAQLEHYLSRLTGRGRGPHATPPAPGAPGTTVCEEMHRWCSADPGNRLAQIATTPNGNLHLAVGFFVSDRFAEAHVSPRVVEDAAVDVLSETFRDLVQELNAG